MPFNLYKASAGSGKTYTLVMEYLKILFRNPEKLGNILCVTFTNKAAGEMKERILLALKSLSAVAQSASGEKTTLYEGLAELFPGARVDKTAAGILEKILHRYSDFHIMTIDSFTYSVIRSFALELGLQPQFEVDLDTAAAVRKAVERVVGRVGTDAFVTDILLKYVFSRLDETSGWNVERDINRAAREFTGESNYADVESVGGISALEMQDFIGLVGKGIEGFYNEMEKRGKAALDLVRESGLKKTDFANGGKGTYTYYERIQLRKQCKDFSPGPLLMEGRWSAKNTPPAVREKIDRLLDGGLSDMAAGIGRYLNEEGALRRYYTLDAVRDNIYTLAIMEAIVREMEDYKKKKHIMLISDFNRKIRDLIVRESIPFIYVMVGETYRHFLLDEFQDTSKLQWENIFPLVDNALAGGHSNLAVGDGKQAIYRWRGGDADIMEKTVREGIDPAKLVQSGLKKNFRSRENIVAFNNRFFRQAAGLLKGAVGGVYDGLEQECRARDGRGLVRVEHISEKDRRKYADAVVDRIAGILDGARKYGYSPGDIAVLVRYNRDGSALADLLLAKGIPVLSPDSLLLAGNPAVRLMVSAFAYLSDPGNGLAAAEVSALYLHTLGLEGEEAEKAFREIPLRGPERFFSSAGLLLRLGIYDLAEELVRLFGLHESSGGAYHGHVLQFLSVVLDYSRSRNGNLTDFLEWWGENSGNLAVAMTGAADAVRIMTIHKAKGLEFPIVVLPFADWEFYKGREMLWLRADSPLDGTGRFDIPLPVNASRRLEESGFASGYRAEKNRALTDNLNLCYVAFTRAADELHVFSPAAAEKKNGDEGFRGMAQLIGRVMAGEFGWDPAAPYITGGRSARDEKKGTDVASREAGRLVTGGWSSRVTVHRYSKDMLKEPGAPGREWGNLLHLVLSEVTDPARARDAVDKYAGLGMIGPGLKDKIAAELDAIFSLPMMRKWMGQGGTSMNEASIVTPGGVIRPDRIFIFGGSAVVLDYKTGKKDDSHAAQLRNYAKAVRRLGYESVEAWLLYIEGRELVRVNTEGAP